MPGTDQCIDAGRRDEFRSPLLDETTMRDPSPAAQEFFRDTRGAVLVGSSDEEKFRIKSFIRLFDTLVIFLDRLKQYMLLVTKDIL